MAKLGDVFNLQMGKTPARANLAYWTGGTNEWVSIADLSSYEKYVEGTKEKITDLAVQESGIKKIPANTVIMSFKLSLGKTAITKTPAYTNEAIMAFLPSGKYDVCPDYFFYLFSGKDWSEGTNRAVMGATLNKATLRNIEIDVPPLDEQRRIAAILDKVTDLINKRRAQLDKLDLLVKSRFVEMFGGIITNSKGWKKDELQNHIDMITGFPFNSTGYSQNGIKICGGLIIMPNQIKWGDCKFWPTSQGYEKFLLQKDDIVVALDRPWISEGFKIGQIHQEDLPALLIQRTARIRGRDLNQNFLLYLLKDKAFEIHCTVKGSLVPHISNKDINSYNIIIPPLELQKQFSDFVTINVQLRQKARHDLEQLEILKESLRQFL